MLKYLKIAIPKISSTKSLSGHPLGAASVHEAIYCLIMMKNKFIAASANITRWMKKQKNFLSVTEVQKNVELMRLCLIALAFGGTNAALVFEKL